MHGSDAREDHAVSPPAPPPPGGALAEAIELLAAGAWQPAHAIVQRQESAVGAWLHGIVHTLEGDLDNARYWYRRAGRAFPGPDAVPEELEAARRVVRDTAPGRQ